MLFIPHFASALSLLPTDPAANVVFIPQGELFLVPFAALQDADNKYLVEKHTILTAPSIQVLDLTYQQKQRKRDRCQRCPGSGQSRIT